MQTESARMSSAAEARFRVQAPNSLPRAVAVVALDETAAREVQRLADAGWRHAVFFTVDPDSDSRVRDLAGAPTEIDDLVRASDLVVLVASPGGRARAATAIGEACSLRRVMTTGFIVGARSASERELSKTLAQIRPWSLMVVVSQSDDYIDDMLIALRA